MAKGDRLSQYDKVYRELDATMIGAERQRFVKLEPGETRYDMYNDIGVADDSILSSEMQKMLTDENDCFIIIHGNSRDKLNFAERVAQYYEAPYIIKEETWRRDPSEQYKIFIKVRG